MPAGNVTQYIIQLASDVKGAKLAKQELKAHRKTHS